MFEIFSFFNHLNEKKKKKHQTETTMNFINLNPYEGGAEEKVQDACVGLPIERLDW